MLFQFNCKKMSDNYKKKKDPVENRRLILEAVIELASTLELSQISFDALAKKCGLSKGGIIHHFPTKEAIFDTLFNENFEEYCSLVQYELAAMETPNPSVALLRVVMRGRDDESHRKLMKVIFKCLVNNDGYCQRWNKWFSEHILAGLDGDSEIAALAGCLAAVGLWNLDALGLYRIETAKMDRILEILSK